MYLMWGKINQYTDKKLTDIGPRSKHGLFRRLIWSFNLALNNRCLNCIHTEFFILYKMKYNIVVTEHLRLGEFLYERNKQHMQLYKD